MDGIAQLVDYSRRLIVTQKKKGFRTARIAGRECVKRGEGMTREEAIKWITYLRENIGKAEYQGLWHYEEPLMDIVEFLQNEQQTGEWLLCDNQSPDDMSNGNYMYFCSNCRKTDVHAKTQKVPYCWWCGAKMRGV